MNYVVAIDLGGTKIDLGLIAPDNTIVARQRIVANTHEGAERVVTRVIEQIDLLKNHLPKDQALTAVGICAPGPLDHESGTLKDPPNIPGLHHAPLAAMLSKKLGVPVKLEHDAKAAALGEYHYGAGRGHKHMVYIVAGTGVGGAMIDDGKLIRGVQNSAGEIGHISLDRHGMVCNCGSRGCAQTYIAGPYLVERYKKLAGEQGSRGAGEKNPFPRSPALPLSRSALTGEDIAQLASQGDEVAQQVLLEAGEALGLLVATLAVTLDVELYVLGGSIAKLGDTLLKPAREIAPKYMLSSLANRVRIELAHLQGDEALLGCAYLVR
jgi:glucokinase